MIRAGTDSFIYPDWPAPASVRALTTTRQGGTSYAPYDSLNVGMHVGDNPSAVAANRRLLPNHQQIAWLDQVHGNTVVSLNNECAPLQPADAAVATAPGVTCAVMTADCLPVLFCHREGIAVAAAHAGWRGLAEGVLEHTLESLPGNAGDYLVWLGPAIGPKAFEVGQEVKDVFPNTTEAFVSLPGDNRKYLADIYLLARHRLQQAGVEQIYQGDYCTYSEPQRFYSYRRDGITGRMVSLIWLSDTA